MSYLDSVAFLIFNELKRLEFELLKIEHKIAEKKLYAIFIGLDEDKSEVMENYINQANNYKAKILTFKNELQYYINRIKQEDDCDNNQKSNMEV